MKDQTTKTYEYKTDGTNTIKSITVPYDLDIPIQMGSTTRIEGKNYTITDFGHTITQETVPYLTQDGGVSYNKTKVIIRIMLSSQQG
jgi:hypothetical protein